LIDSKLQKKGSHGIGAREGREPETKGNNKIRQLLKELSF